MKGTNRLFRLVLALAVFILFPSPSRGADTIRVGFVDAHSEPPSSLSADVLDGLNFAVRKINGEGGVLGRKIVAIANGKTAPDGAVSKVRSLVRDGKADILIATADRSAAPDLADFAAKEKVPLFVTFSESPLVGGREGNRYVFTMSESPRMAGAAAAMMLHEKPYENYWIAGDDDDYGHALADGLWGTLKVLEPGFRLVGQSWWKPDEKDFTPYIRQILAAKPDFVVAATGPSNIARFQKAAKAAGLAGKIPFYQHWANEHAVLSEQGKDAPEGVYGTASYLFYNPSTPLNKDFTEDFRKTFHRYPGIGAFYGYITVRLIAEGYRKAGEIDGETLMTALEGMRLDSPAGTVMLRSCDHQLALPIFLGLTGKVLGYPDFLASVSLQSIDAQYYMRDCQEGPGTKKR